MEHPVTRLLTVLELLQAYRRLSGAELARRLEVAPRTVRRYITTLQELGIPVEAELGRHGGYRLRPGYKLPPLMLSEDEALAVVLGLLAGRRMGLLGSGQAVEGALAKLDRVLPETLRDRMRATQDTVGLGLTPVSRETFDPDVLLTVSAATRDRSRVRIGYRARQGARTERQIDPYGVVFQNGHWYVVGWDHLRRDVRTFRLDRVQSAAALPASFVPPDGFDAVATVQEAIASAPWAFAVEVVLALPIEQARRRVSPTTGTLSRHADGTLLRLGADNLEWMAGYLASLGCGFQIVQPPELREAVRTLAAELTACADAADLTRPE
jgi:predicted DNA-binding transcriptional regulator YafY